MGRRKKDLNWRKERKKGKVTPSSSRYTQENTIKMMQSARSPAKKAAVLSDYDLSMLVDLGPTLLLTPSKYQLSTPEKGPLTTSINTPNGSKLLPAQVIKTHQGTLSFCLSEDKVPAQQVELPPQPHNWVAKDSPVPKASMAGMKDMVFTKESIMAVMALINERKRQGKSPRCEGQVNVTGITAYEAITLAGFKVNQDDVQWLHFGSHWNLGDAAQVVENLGLGTKYANAAMELVNPVLYALLMENKYQVKKLYVDVIPHWEPGYENIRLMHSLDFIIKDGPDNTGKRHLTIPFNTLTLGRTCLTLAPLNKKLICDTFENSVKPASVVDATPLRRSRTLKF